LRVSRGIAGKLRAESLPAGPVRRALIRLEEGRDDELHAERLCRCDRAVEIRAYHVDVEMAGLGSQSDLVQRRLVGLRIVVLIVIGLDVRVADGLQRTELFFERRKVA